MSHSGKLPLQQHNHPLRSFGLDDFMDEQYRRTMVYGGVELPGRTVQEWRAGAAVRTSDGWAAVNSVPPQAGRVHKQAYRDGRWLALVLWEQPGLFPAEPDMVPRY